ncbi:C2 domain protein [Gregarina niphandrodes]|uniref:C2 domain protein n=1 Tax=Gregarina niphandrodes TaxID=110365 RepID=A0A023B7I6_GRENI|nr:C2 domain protein [Gregarina niphandrodes]EZG67250.1 C2 domain protein [Gregarina niphandrodes]|eukprot:XP_011130295.1 C2 domain protein [Gregarina niphandrodes]
MPALLSITVHEGKGLAGGFLGRRDPYLIGTMGDQKFHTSAVNNNGKNPLWDQTFALPYNGEPTIEMEIYDRDRMRKDDLMGTGRIQLDILQIQNFIQYDVPIEKRGKPAGIVRITLSLAVS